MISGVLAMMGVVNELVREGVLSDLLYTADFVMMSETIEGLWIKFSKWKESFESMDLKVMVW